MKKTPNLSSEKSLLKIKERVLEECSNLGFGLDKPFDKTIDITIKETGKHYAKRLKKANTSKEVLDIAREMEQD